MRIVITGATGNVGTAFLRRVGRSDHDVVGIARRVPPSQYPYDRAEKWWPLDVGASDSSETLAQAFGGADVVVHLAWGFQPSRRREYLRRTAVDGTAHVLTAAAKAGVGHFVHMSSGAVYSPDPPVPIVTEDCPRSGISASVYSSDKVAVEAMLDSLENALDLPIARLRPGLVGQRSAASAFLRYGIPAAVPAKVLTWTPLLPVDRSLAMPVVHADDVADAIVRVIERRAVGAFNLAAESPIGPDDIAQSLHSRDFHVPWRLIARLVDLTWRAHLQSVPAGWIHLAFMTPMLDCTRARHELGWLPAHDARSVIDELFDGVRGADSGGSPVLRRRRVSYELQRLLREGSVSRRRLS